jgi:glycosyltransferase involved in cell wall biosynthesis
MDQTAKISVIVTLYNVEKYARDSISCIVNQTYRNLEILCINDGSTDGTLAIANEFAAADPRIKVITKENSGCAAGAINAGLDLATGDDIYVMDGDDKISPDALEKMKARQLETDADMTICDKWHIYPDHPEKNWAWLGVTEQVGKTNENPDRDIILCGRDAIPYTLVTWRMTGKGLYKRSLFDTIRYNTKGINGDEVTIREMFIKSKRIAFPAANIITCSTINRLPKKSDPVILTCSSPTRICTICWSNIISAKTLSLNGKNCGSRNWPTTAAIISTTSISYHRTSAPKSKRF